MVFYALLMFSRPTCCFCLLLVFCLCVLLLFCFSAFPLLCLSALLFCSSAYLLRRCSFCLLPGTASRFLLVLASAFVFLLFHDDDDDDYYYYYYYYYYHHHNHCYKNTEPRWTLSEPVAVAQTCLQMGGPTQPAFFLCQSPPRGPG